MTIRIPDKNISDMFVHWVYEQAVGVQNLMTMIIGFPENRNFVKILDNFMLPLLDMITPNSSLQLRAQMNQICPK